MYTLIIIAMLAGNISITHIDYGDLETCRLAQGEVMARNRKGHTGPSFDSFCVIGG